MTSQKQAFHIDETIIVDQIKATHNLNSETDVNTTLVLNFVEDVFNLNTVKKEAMQDKLQLQDHIQKKITSHVLQLVFEIAYNCSNHVDSHSIAIHLLSVLSMYPWHTKVVLMIASFAIICGQFKVALQSCYRRGLTFNLGILKQRINSMHSPNNERLVLDDSIKSILDLTKLTIELQDSSSIILTNYWIARSVVACASHHILGLKSQKQLKELSNSSTKIKEIMTFSCAALEVKRTEENYHALLNAFQNSSDIVEVLKLIFNVKNDKEKPILDGIRMREHKNRPVGLHLFQGEGVLLLISSGKHFPFYAYYYASQRVKMIWVPITNDLEEHIQMPDRNFNYYCVLDPQKWVAPEFIRFLTDKCFPIFQVGGDPIVISLDNRGRLVHSNALHMIFTWGYQLTNERTMRSGDIIIPSLENELRERTFGADRVIGDIEMQTDDFAREVRKKINDWVEDIMTKTKSSYRSYNYTSEREQVLWGKESWNLKFVVGNYSTLKRWIFAENYIFLCGGNNNKQVQEFTHKIKEVCLKIQVNIQIAYIGRSGKMDKKVMRREWECDYAFDSSTHKLFWIRLQGMALSRIQYLSKVRLDEKNDEIMKGLKKLLAYEAEGSTVGVWALLSKGNRIIACDMGEKMYGVMNEYEKWEENAQENCFDKAFKDCYEMLSSSSPTLTQHPCCALNYASNLEKISETISCPQCNHNMQKVVTFSCCHGSMTDLYNLNFN